jgi:hypothetical protein
LKESAEEVGESVDPQGLLPSSPSQTWVSVDWASSIPLSNFTDFGSKILCEWVNVFIGRAFLRRTTTSFAFFERVKPRAPEMESQGGKRLANASLRAKYFSRLLFMPQVMDSE